MCDIWESNRALLLIYLSVGNMLWFLVLSCVPCPKKSKVCYHACDGGIWLGLHLFIYFPYMQHSFYLHSCSRSQRQEMLTCASCFETIMAYPRLAKRHFVGMPANKKNLTPENEMKTVSFFN